MSNGPVVPQGLAGMPPGPGLAAVLDGLELGRVPNDEIVEVLEARSRQLAHEQAQVFAVMNEVLHRLPALPGAVRRGPGPRTCGSDEVRAALAWSRRSAERETDLAFVLVVRLPRVQEALLEGFIDRGKAVVFAEHLADVTAEQATTICGRVLPVAGGLTPGQIADRIKRLILQLDPEYYRRRYAKAVRDRRVIAYLDGDGAAVVTGSGLPAEDAAAAVERIDRLAREVRRAGHPGTLDQVRADVFLGLLDGSLHGLSRGELVAALLARGARPEDAGPGGSGGVERASAAPQGADVASPDPAASTDPDAPADASTGFVAGPGGVVLDGGLVPVAGVEVRVALSTLLGRDEWPGELPGLGPVPAASARTIVARQMRGEWRWVVVDAEGRWSSDGLTRYRPAGAPGSAARGGVVELQISETLLAELVADPSVAGVWARVVADVAAQHGDRERRMRDLDGHPEDRFPRAGLRRHVQIRDRFCVFRGCRTPARWADQDHTVEHARGGPTAAADLGPACRHDHVLKTEGGWDLCQPEPGVFVWTSPLGRRYPVRPEPILPPPVDPVTREPEAWHDEPADPTERPLDLRPPTRAPPPSAARRPDPRNGAGDTDDPPPF